MGAISRAIQDLLESFYQVDHVGGDLRLGAFGVYKFLHRRIRPDRFFNLLLLQQHLRGGLEFFVLEQPVDQFRARIFLRVCRQPAGSRGSSIFDLMWISTAAM